MDLFGQVGCCNGALTDRWLHQRKRPRIASLGCPAPLARSCLVENSLALFRPKIDFLKAIAVPLNSHPLETILTSFALSYCLGLHLLFPTRYSRHA
jgi:hypothetical protein